MYKDCNWDDVLKKSKIPQSIINREYKYMCSRTLVITQQLTEDFIRSHWGDLSVKLISEHQNLSNDFIVEFKDKLNWHSLTTTHDFAESFIDEHIEYIHWVVQSEKLNSIDQINKYIDRVYFNRLNYVYINQSFVEKHIDKDFDWNKLLKYVSFDVAFLNEHIDKFNIVDILNNQLIDQKFIECNFKKIHKSIVSSKEQCRVTQYSLLDDYTYSQDFISDNFEFFNVMHTFVKYKFDVNFLTKHLDDSNEFYILAYQDIPDSWYINANVKKYKIKKYLDDGDVVYLNQITNQLYVCSSASNIHRWLV